MAYMQPLCSRNQIRAHTALIMSPLSVGGSDCLYTTSTWRMRCRKLDLGEETRWYSCRATAGSDWGTKPPAQTVGLGTAAASEQEQRFLVVR